MITTTIIPSSLSKLFIRYAKTVILPEIKSWIENRLKLNSEVKACQYCYGYLDSHSWQTLQFYINDINTLFSINIGIDEGKNSENFSKDVVFVEVNIYKGDNNGDIIYTESNDIERWELMLGDFYQRLAQYFNRNFEQ